MSFEETLYRLPSPRADRQRVSFVVLASVAADLLAALSLSTQSFARAWRFSPEFGRPWIVRPLYPDLVALSVALCLAAFAVWLVVASRRARPSVVLALPLLPPIALVGVEPLYPPLAILGWSSRWSKVAALAPTFASARLTFQIAVGANLACTAIVAVAMLHRYRTTGDIHGSSHWATPSELRATGLLDHER